MKHVINNQGSGFKKYTLLIIMAVPKRLEYVLFSLIRAVIEKYI